VNTVYIIAVMTSLNCGVNVLCFRSVEPDSSGHARTYDMTLRTLVSLRTKASRLSTLLCANRR